MDIDSNMKSVIEEIINNSHELNGLLHNNPYEMNGNNRGVVTSLGLMEANNGMVPFNGLQEPLTSASSGTGIYSTT